MLNRDNCSLIKVNNTGSGFDLAWFSSLSSDCFCIFDLHGAIGLYIFRSYELNLVELALDLVN